MKKILLFVLLLSSVMSYAQFGKWFENKTLRLDYYHNGNHDKDIYSFDELLEEPYWGGSKTNLIDTFGYGNYFYKVSDAVSHQLLYSHGYSTLFYEWQTTKEADTIWRSFSESVVFLSLKNQWMLKFSSVPEKENGNQCSATGLILQTILLKKTEDSNTPISMSVLPVILPTVST